MADRHQRSVADTSDLSTSAMNLAEVCGTEMNKVIESSLQIVKRLGDDTFTRLELASGEIILVHLDGKESYVYGQPNFSLGIVYQIDRVPVFSGVFNPYYNEFYFAEQGKEVKRNNVSTGVNRIGGLHNSFIGFSFRGAYDKVGMRMLSTFFNVMRTPVRTMIPGSDLYGLTLVANGNLNAMAIAVPRHELILPGLALVEAAGGMVTDERGERADATSKLIIASNGLIHHELLQQFAMSVEF